MCVSLLLAATVSVSASSVPSETLTAAVRQARAAGGGEIVLADGLHVLGRPLELTAADADLTFRAADGARPVLSAGRVVTGWTVGADGVWRARLATTNRFSQLYVNGQRRERPFLPRQGYFRVLDAGPQEEGQRYHAKFAYPEGTFDPSWPNWRDFNNLEVRVFHNWSNTRMRIKEVDARKRTIALAGLNDKSCSDSAFTSRFWFRLENVRWAFGEPGDWYQTDDGELWYLPKAGETPANSQVIASCLDRVIRIDGARRISFRGITFAHADETLKGDGRYYGQAGFFLPGAVHAVNAREITFEDCAFAHVGSFGLVFAENCHGCRAKGCEFFDLGAGGVRIGNGSFEKDHAPDASTCVIEDCHLAHGGRVDPVSAAIWIGNASTNRVSNCTIEDFYYSGISCGWDWGLTNRRSHHNILENNLIFNIGQKVLSDLGGIYTLAQQPGTVVRANVIRDVSCSIYMGTGIYLDEFSSFITVSNNCVSAVDDSCLFLQSSSRSNLVTRNVFRAERPAGSVFGFCGSHRDWLPSQVVDNRYELGPKTRLNLREPLAGTLFAGNVFAPFPKTLPGAGKRTPDRLTSGLPDVPRTFGPGLGPLTTEKSYAETFEQTPVGEMCKGLIPYPKVKASTFVTDETAYEGKRSYKFIDGISPDWAPHVNRCVYRKSGRIEISFAMRVEEGAAPLFQLRRDQWQDQPAGPALLVDRAGMLHAVRGKALMKLARGQWYKFELSFVLGDERTQAVYEVAVTDATGKRRVFADNPYDEGFEKLEWFGFISLGAKGSVYYVDDIRICSPMRSGSVDFSRVTGKLRPELHSSGFGPQICSCPPQVIADIKSMRFAASRTHDWALINPGQRVCDYFHIFPLPDLDAANPAHYVFGPTDYLLRRTREELGHDVFFRLGTSIEHSGNKVHFNAAIPKDFDKTIETFAGTIRHYNHGWANGYEWNIRYWEIWNEPDGPRNMWCLPEGDMVDGNDPVAQDARDAKRRRLFIDFYVRALKRLKREFPNEKIGGPAMCWMDRRYFSELLQACKDAGVAPDFISWHHYAEDPRIISDAIATGRRLCDRYGFTACELIINEWHYFAFSDYDWGDLRSPDPEKRRICWEGPRSHNGIDSSCFNLTVLAQMQDSALSQGFYYGCSNVGSWGYKDEIGRKYKVYSGLKLFGEFVNTYSLKCAASVATVEGLPAVTVFAGKTADGKKKGLLVTDYRSRAEVFGLKVAGVEPNASVKAWIHDQAHDFTPVPVSFANGLLTLRKHDTESAAFLITFE